MQGGDPACPLTSPAEAVTKVLSEGLRASQNLAVGPQVPRSQEKVGFSWACTGKGELVLGGEGDLMLASHLGGSREGGSSRPSGAVGSLEARLKGD